MIAPLAQVNKPIALSEAAPGIAERQLGAFLFPKIDSALTPEGLPSPGPGPAKTQE